MRKEKAEGGDRDIKKSDGKNKFILKDEEARRFMLAFDERYEYNALHMTAYIDERMVTVYDDNDNTLIYEDFINGPFKEIEELLVELNIQCK